MLSSMPNFWQVAQSKVSMTQTTSMVVMTIRDSNFFQQLKLINMKKYLFSALALPLLFACSSEDFDEKVVSNDQFGGIAKVDATFSMDEAFTRFDGGVWTTEEGDLWGFAWMGGVGGVGIDGKAYQNHNLIQTSGIFTPQTSIYVGKYYIYRPYDKTTVSPQAINFKSLEEQPLAEGYESAKQAWKDLAKTAINIGDCWTDVTATGHTIGTDPTVWDKAGIKEHYKIYAAMFSNQTGLDLTYKKNNPKFASAQTINGATDINYTIAKNTEVGSADIYEATVDLDGQAKSFTYAPTVSPNGTSHSGTYWANKKNLGATEGFTFTDDVITLTPADAKNGLSTGADGSEGWFWFNSLPVTAGSGALTTAVQTVFTTSYGVVTVNSTVKDCAYVFDKYNTSATSAEWIKLDNADKSNTTPKQWNLASTSHNTFINQYGNHKGKYALTVDFSTGVMNNMHIKSDAHLQKLLKFYIASGKTETVTLNLDEASATDNTFKISKISIALLQTINKSATKVLVQACGTHGTPKIIVTQDGQAEIGLADKKEVPALDKVFAAATDVYLSSDCEWTWKGGDDGTKKLTVDANVTSLTNEGALTVNATNVQLSTAAPLANAAGATMNITKVTTIKNALTNLGTINVGAADNTAAELRAYGIEIKNDATALNAFGTINNYGVVGVTAGTGGSFNNYGLIDMMNDGAITLLSSNELNANTAPDGPFKTPFVAATNMMGTVVLPEGNPTAIVSVANTDETGFIKYNWTAATYSHDTRNVKYNTLVISNDITFQGSTWNPASEIKFIEFNGTRTQVVNPTGDGILPNLRGVIVNAGKSIIIEKTNELVCSDGAFLGAGATVYKGGIFNYVSTNNYLGTWSTDQIIEY